VTTGSRVLPNQTARADFALDGTDSMGLTAKGEIRPTTLRWVVNHLIEETARHAGTIDITPRASRRENRSPTPASSAHHPVGSKPVAAVIAVTRRLAVPSTACAMGEDGWESALAIA
jgi:hypothetical protein